MQSYDARRLQVIQWCAALPAAERPFRMNLRGERLIEEVRGDDDGSH